MRRSTRPSVIVGAAAALALATAGWLTSSAAVADDAPTPDPTGIATDAPTAPGAVKEIPVDPNGPALPTPENTLPGLHKPSTSSPGLKLPKSPTPMPATTIHGNSFKSAVVPDATGTSRYWPQVSFDSTSATVESGEPRKLEAGRVLLNTMWMKWKSPKTGWVSVYTDAGSGTDTGINVYTGSSLTKLTRVAWNDDQYDPVDGAALTSGSPSRDAAILSLPVKAGTTYYVQVGTSVASTTTSTPGFTQLDVGFFPNRYVLSNDFLSAAATLSLPAGSGAVKTFSAVLSGGTIEPWEPTDNNDDAANVRDGSVWYKFTAPQSGIAEMTTCTFLGAPAIGVFTSEDGSEGSGTGYGDLAAVAFDAAANPSCGFLGGGADTSWIVAQNKTYFIQISHLANDYPASIADVTLSVIFGQPYIDKLSKTSAHQGNTITITGQALNAGTPVVKFGSKTATIVGSPTSTSIVVKVPNVSDGSYYVTVTNTAATPDDVSNKVKIKIS